MSHDALARDMESLLGTSSLHFRTTPTALDFSRGRRAVTNRQGLRNVKPIRASWQCHALAVAKEQEGERDTLRSRRRSCECHDRYNELIPYTEAWQWQKLCVEEKVAMLAAGEDFDDTVILLQHPPVYTLGTRSSEAHLKFDVEHPPFELHRTERGGEVGTVHRSFISAEIAKP